MLPTDQKIRELWVKYQMPEIKKKHLLAVTRVADYLAKQLVMKGYSVDTPLVHASAMLHDIDKGAPKLPGERHPDAAVRILNTEGFPAIADLTRKHSLHTILDPNLAPKSLEEKILYLADKMAKYEVITVDRRFELWRSEPAIQGEGRVILQNSYSKVKDLENEILSIIGVKPEQLASLV